MRWFNFPAIPVSKRIRNEPVDYDYVETLGPEEYKFLRAFTREYYNADFKHKGKKLHKKAQRKVIFRMNNSRNRCLYSLLRCRNRLVTFSTLGDK